MGTNKNLFKSVIPWLVSGIFLLIGVIFYFFVSGCAFLGIVFGGVAAICVIDNLFAIWQERKAVRVAKTAWSVVLILILAAALITVILVLQGPADTGISSGYVIVLGAGVRGTEPSEILADRIQMAAQYLKDHPDAVCIATGGMGNDENISEAQCIYNHLTAMGIDGSRIWMEDKATSTIENFRYSIALIEEKTGAVPESVTVLSNEFHLYRASRMAQDCGLEASFIAAPTSKPLIRISYTIREIFALWKYLTIGG
jgi:uncharacterized SAM-binding protein YcdF (DUF218 family)